MVGGPLDLDSCTSLTHLPEGLVTHRYLDLRGSSSLTTLPPDLKTELIYCDKELIDKIPQEDLPLYINFNYEDSIREHLTKRLQG